jgi:hypothetical protein
MGGVSPWRIAAAIGLIVLLTAVLVWQVVDWSGNDDRASEEVTVDTPPSPVVSDEDLWIGAAHEALDAWAVYASTGDLAVVEGFVDPDGPQYAQLLAEASTLVPGGGVYSFILEDPTAELRDGFPVVTALVVISLDGDSIEELAWDVHLIENGGRWLLWTVEERP